MTQVEGIPFQRHGPSAALQDFLEPLNPGGYLDCGQARLFGIDDALVDEAGRRGRAAGDDTFQLVACDIGLVYCRPSIGFAITANWSEVVMTRPQGTDEPTALKVKWPKHGELEFSVSERLAANIFRRWLQLQMREVHQSRLMPRQVFPPGVNQLLTHSVETDNAHDAADGRLTPESDVPLGVSASVEQPNLKRKGFYPVEAEEELQPQADEGVFGQAAASGVRRTILGTDTSSGYDPQAETDSVGRGPTGGQVALIADQDLQRVPIPKQATTPSWVGSPLSLVVALVVLSSAVLLAAVAVGLSRRQAQTALPVAPNNPGIEVAATSSTLDHQRFRPSANSQAPSPAASVDVLPAATSDDLADQSNVESNSAPADPEVALVGGDVEGNADAEPDAGQRASASSQDTNSEVAGSPETVDERSEAADDQNSSGETSAPLVDTTGAEGALRCDSNYSGCVPPVAGLEAAPGVQLDVDCEGHGDGPWLVSEQVLVLGTDIYGLDVDGNGVGCEEGTPGEDPGMPSDDP